MRKLTGRDFDFVLNALIIALVVMAVMHAIKPIVAPEPNRTPEIQAFLKDVQPISPVALEKKLHGQPSMLVVYATWCTYCRHLVPEVVSLIQEKKLGKVQPVLMALDKEPGDLSSYMVRNNYKGTYTPYIIEEGRSHQLPGVLAMTGADFKGGIPYVGFFDSQGKLVAESFGMVDKEQLLANARKINNQ